MPSLCVVSGCLNSSTNLDKHNQINCLLHNQLYKVCPCPPPFKLFPIPDPTKKPVEYSRYCTLINRRDPKSMLLWQPSKHAKICSKHFPDSAPTERNPYPILCMGYNHASSLNALLRMPEWVSNVKRLGKPQETTDTETVPPDDAPPEAFVTKPGTSTLPHRVSQRLVMPSPGRDPVEPPQQRPKRARLHTLLETGFQKMETSSESDTEARGMQKMKFEVHRTDLSLEPGENVTSTSSASPAASTDSNSTPVFEPADQIGDHTPRQDWDRIRAENVELKKKLKRKDKKSDKSRTTIHRDVFNLSSDSAVKFYTGIPNVNMLDFIWKMIKPAAKKIRFWQCQSPPKSGVRGKKKLEKLARGRSRKLDLHDEFIMTLVRLRLGYLEQDLAYHYGVSITTVSRTIITWLKFLDQALSPLIAMPPSENVRNAMPEAFDRCSRVTHIVDCTEVFIERSRDPIIQAMTWSSYKHHNTVKVLVDITPNGYIQYVSNAYVGRISDVELVKVCGWLELLEPNQVIMADRGFTIRGELTECLCELYIPEGKRGARQLSEEQVARTKSVANVRIFVEQAIERLKEFRFLKAEVPLSVSMTIKHAVRIAAALTNLNRPLCK